MALSSAPVPKDSKTDEKWTGLFKLPPGQLIFNFFDVRSLGRAASTTKAAAVPAKKAYYLHAKIALEQFALYPEIAGKVLAERQ